MSQLYKLVHQDNQQFLDKITRELADKDEALRNLNWQIGLPFVEERYKLGRFLLIVGLVIAALLLMYVGGFALGIIFPKLAVFPLRQEYAIGYLFAFCGPFPTGVVSLAISASFIFHVYHLSTDYLDTAHSRYSHLTRHGVNLKGEIIQRRLRLHPQVEYAYKFLSPEGKPLKGRYTTEFNNSLAKGDEIVVLYVDKRTHLLL